MKRLLPLLLVLLSSAAFADMTTINKKGSEVDIKSHLVPDKETYVVFHHKATYLSFQLYNSLTKYSQSHPGVPILVIESEPNSPVTRQYHVRTFPYVQIYDVRGDLKSEGPPAYKTVNAMISQ
ncbi:unnamed protein product [Phaeothamnion confervicola]